MNKAFTLVELLVVISIISLLSSISLSSLQSARSLARDSARHKIVNQLETALEMYYLKYGQYPLSAPCPGTYPNSSWCNSSQSDVNGFWLPTSINEFLSIHPIDPKPLGQTPSNFNDDGVIFYYSATSGGCTHYRLSIKFEDDSINAQDTYVDSGGCSAPVRNYQKTIIKAAKSF